MNKKTFLLYCFYLFYISFLWIIADLLASNFIIKDQTTVIGVSQKTCTDIQKDFYKLKKNCKVKERLTDNSWRSVLPAVDILTNEFGHRFNGKTKSSEKKIFFFGDSQTYGVGVDYDDSFVGIVDNSALNYKVFNFAVPSYSPQVYFYQLQEILNQDIIPNKIVLALDISDIKDDSHRWKIGANNKPIEVCPLSEGGRCGLVKKRPVIDFIKKNFQITKFCFISIYPFYKKIAYMINPSDAISGSGNTIVGNFTYTKVENLSSEMWKPGQFEAGINKIDQNLYKISELAKKYNFEFYLLIFPWAETLQYGQEHFNLENFAYDLSKKYDFNVINIFPVFSKIKQENKYWYDKLYFFNDTHLNKSGHKIVGNYIATYLL